MKSKVLLAFFLVFIFTGFVSAEKDYKFDSIKVKFVDSLTLEPITNSEITVYPDGRYEETKIYITDSKGEIVIPVEAESYNLRSDKGDNINYVKSGGSVLIETLEKPEFIYYMNPIFDIKVHLKTDFNFLLGFFRMFRYGSYVQYPNSNVNTESVIEPNCFMQTPDKGTTIRQYRKTFNVRAYFSRDLNSPTKEPNKCSIYAWESIRKIAGIKEINFNELSRNGMNQFELTLDEDYGTLLEKLSYKDESVCSDGTLPNTCSSQKPKFCYNNQLLDNCEACGCKNGFVCEMSNSTCSPVGCSNNSDCNDNNNQTIDICLAPNQRGAQCIHTEKLLGHKKLLIIEFAPENISYGSVYLCGSENTKYLADLPIYCDNLIDSYNFLEMTNDVSGQISFSNFSSNLAHPQKSFFYLNDFIKKEAQSYNVQNIPSFSIDLLGPFELNDLPPKTSFVEGMSLLNNYFNQKILEQGINISGYDIVAIVYFNDEGLVLSANSDGSNAVRVTEDRHRFVNHAGNNIVYLSLDTFRTMEVHGVHVLAHEILHHFGATDKYVFGEGEDAHDWCHQFECCLDPEGIPEPNKIPKYPQTKGCTMCAGGQIVIEKGVEGQTPESMDDTVVCQKTAEEIGWI